MDKRITCNAATMVGHDGNPDEGLRVYNSAPNQITVQVRTNGPTAPSGKGVARPAYSTAWLTRCDTEELIETGGTKEKVIFYRWRL